MGPLLILSRPFELSPGQPPPVLPGGWFCAILWVQCRHLLTAILGQSRSFSAGLWAVVVSWALLVEILSDLGDHVLHQDLKISEEGEDGSVEGRGPSACIY